MVPRPARIDEIERTLIEHQVPVSRVYDAADIAADPHVAAREAIVDGRRPVARPGPPAGPHPAARPDARSPFPRGAPRSSVQHTSEVLSELLGLTADEVEALRADGVV